MKQMQNVSLKDYSTMRLGGTAAYAVEVANAEELESVLTWADAQQLSAIMIGDGSNIVWRDETFPGVLTVGSGENWDEIVKKTVDAGLTGIEALSLIPGTCGATPVQNVGAYGQEIANVFVSARAYDRETKTLALLSKYDCEFGYRTSRFKLKEHGRFFITSITLHLQHKNPEPPFYKALERYLAERSITQFTPQVIRDAVIAIRRSKLPDPAVVANNGSFFSNPIIDEGTLVQLQANYPDIAFWRMDNGDVKLSAAWLIEHAGFKDYHDQETGMATWPSQPLVLVNEHATSTADLLKFRQKLIDTVAQKFGVPLKQEPEILPLDAEFKS
jgi:UDP-N-acetylmuramate dehydrogenase